MPRGDRKQAPRLRHGECGITAYKGEEQAAEQLELQSWVLFPGWVGRHMDEALVGQAQTLLECKPLPRSVKGLAPDQKHILT